ncbi:MAG TPA: flagellin [Candidatus Paceibacterota bacterium]|nr:flagellin [Candidatus Paceibacterota bacterium]
MFISNDALIQTLTGQITAQANNIAELQMQLASGRVLNKPSDNPAAVTHVLMLSSQAKQLTSWQTNVDAATSWLGIANSTANNVLGALQSARSILLQAANQGVQSPITYSALGTELKGISANLLSLSNTQYAGRAIFAGTSASPQAYDATGNFLGNNDSPSTVIGPGSGVGQSVNLSVVGTAIFGVGASNAFATLSSAVAALLSGAPTSANISSALNALENVISGAQQSAAALGSASQMVSSASSALTIQIANVQSNQANLENVNVATAATQLSLETTSYQAALWAVSRAIPETLVKFL